MEEAYVYCIPLDETSVKIGSHLGSLQKLDAAYGSAVTYERLAQKSYFRVEPAYRLHYERVVQSQLKRIDQGALFVEKEKFKKEAVVAFKCYALQFALRVEDIENDDVPNDDEAQEIYEVIKRLKTDQRLLTLKKLENDKKEAEPQEREALERKQREEEEAKQRALDREAQKIREEREEEERIRNDPSILFRQQFIVNDVLGAVKWAELRENYKIWYNLTYGENLYGRCDDVKKKFVAHLGPSKVMSHKNYKFDGFKGYRLLNLPANSSKSDR